MISGRTFLRRFGCWSRPLLVPRHAASIQVATGGENAREGFSKFTLASFAALAGGAAVLAAGVEDAVKDDSHPLNKCGVRRSDLPNYTKAEINQHDKLESGMWVTFRDGVYDITPFVEAHPGGATRIVQAAGGPLEPFWNVFQQHLTRPATYNVAQQLEMLRVGNVAPGEDMMEGIEAADDDQPSRHPLLQQHTTAPCNAEAPMSVIQHEYITPVALHYVRHHHPVPMLDKDSYELRLDIADSAVDVYYDALQKHPDMSAEEVKAALKERRVDGHVIKTWSFKELVESLPKHTVVATLMCAGNRRSGLNTVAQTQGLNWDCGAISTGKYRGVKLADVLRAAGIHEEGPFNPEEYHVQFIAADMPYDASIPLWRALNSRNDVLLAFEQNDEDVPADHGAPIRLIVPGHVGARSVKWLTGIRISPRPSPSPWQSGKPYRLWGPYVKNLDEMPADAAAPVAELPVQSVITSPTPNAKITAEDDGEGNITVPAQGYAFSGGGRKIVRVDVSADGGHTWHPAELEDGDDQPVGRAWAWTLWRADIPVTDLSAGGDPGTPAVLVVKAVDEAANTQPERPHGIWNVRGILNNSWHQIPVRVMPPVEETDEE